MTRETDEAMAAPRVMGMCNIDDGTLIMAFKYNPDGTCDLLLDDDEFE